MITISNASDALKTIYLGVIAEQLNTKINPFLAAIERTSNNVFGKEVKKLVTYGVNGGITSGTETGALPKAQGNSYVTLTTDLKNFFGKIEISDKALRASMDDSGAFVNLLNAEMEGLLSASKRNFARMLFGDGSGKLATTVVYADNEDLAKFKVDDASKIEAGMVIDIETNGAITSATKNKVIKSVDHTNNVVTLTSNLPSVQGKDSIVYVQGSRNNELTGLESIFGTSSTLYGLTRAEYDFLTPYNDATGGANGELEMLYFGASDLTSDDLVLDTENELIETPSSRKNMVLELMNLGLLTDENGRYSERTKCKILETLGFGNWENSRDIADLHLKKAQRENRAFGEREIIPDSFDDHEIHIEEHTKFMLSPEFDMDVKMKETIAAHVNKHREFIDAANINL